MTALILSGGKKRKLDPRLAKLGKNTQIRFGVQLSSESAALAKSIGFSDELAVGDSLLPPSRIGPVCSFNADGKEKVRKDLPMETAYRQREWHWTEFHGPYEKVERSDIVDVPYQRYPRTLIPPPSVELSIAADKEGGKYLLTPISIIGKDPEDAILHKINLLLEIFGQCLAFTDELKTIAMPQVRRVHWEILPAGEHPWPHIREKVEEVLDAVNEQKRVVVEHRLQKINDHSPHFVAIGRAGFSGYLVFGFPDKHLYVLESIYTGNATYVFANNWENLSMKTKAEILHGNLQKDRIIHRQGWDTRIDDLLSVARSISKKVTRRNIQKTQKNSRKSMQRA